MLEGGNGQIINTGLGCYIGKLFLSSIDNSILTCSQITSVTFQQWSFINTIHDLFSIYCLNFWSQHLTQFDNAHSLYMRGFVFIDYQLLQFISSCINLRNITNMKHFSVMYLSLSLAPWFIIFSFHCNSQC